MLLQDLKKAFTLAEVLMVIAVIGITASLTLPQVNNGMEDKKVVAALRKIYPELQSAYEAVVSKHGSPVEWTVPSGSTRSSMMYNYLLQELSVAKGCGSSSGCFISDNNLETASLHYKMILKDDSFLSVWVNNDDLNTVIRNVQTGSDNCGHMGDIYVDVNGKNGENQNGMDIFGFNICYEGGITPKGTELSTPYTADAKTAWVIKAGNRDYLKCNDLNWNTKRTCK